MKLSWFFTTLTILSLAISCQQDDAARLAALAQHEMPADQAQAQPLVVNNNLVESQVGKRNAEEMVAAGFKRYSIEKGVFTFRLYGAVTGYEVLYFDHWGWREGRYIRTKTDVGDFQETTNAVKYLDGERRYEYDPETQVAHYFDSPQVQASAEKYQTKDMALVGDEMIKNMGGVAVGMDKVREMDCQVWKIERMKTTLCMAHGITLREESFASNIPVSRVAISIKTDVEVPVDKMTVPEGTKEVDINAN